MFRQMYNNDVNLLERLQWILDSQGITQRELSRRAGFNGAQVGSLMKRLRERPDASIEYDTAVAIANAAHVNVEWLRSGVGKRDAEQAVRATQTERALFEAAKDLRVDLEDFEAARAALKDTSFLLSGDLLEFARDWLVAAQQLRKEGHPVNAATIGTRATVNAAKKLHEEVEGLRKDLKRHE